jgi:hypothetical protein
VITGQDEIALARATKAHYDAEKALKKHEAAQKALNKATKDGIEIEFEHGQIRKNALDKHDQNGTLGSNGIDIDVDAAIERKFQERANRMAEARKKYEEQIDFLRNGGSNAPGANGEGAARSPWQQMLDQMRAVDLQTEAMTKGMGALNDAIDQLVETGKVNFHSLVESMIKDLTKLALQKAFGEFLTWASGGPASLPIGSTGGPPGFLGAHASGGSHMLTGGSGEEVPYFLTARRGERLDVLTPAQQTAQAANSNGRGGGVVIHNHLDRREFIAAFDDDQDFDRVVNNVISRREARRGRRG